MTIKKKITFSLTSDVSSDVQIQFAVYSEISRPDLLNAVFGSNIGPVVWQLAGEGGGGAKRPLPKGGQGT